MDDTLGQFEGIVRKAHLFTESTPKPPGGLHPFDERNIHPRLPPDVKRLFDDGYYAQATFEAFKFVDKEVQRHSGSSQTGFNLMMQVFSETTPIIKLTPLKEISEIDEQRGYRHIFAGAASGIRNPRGHECFLSDTPDECLDHLSLASLLLRRLEEAGFR